MDINLLIEETARNAVKNIPIAAEDYYGTDGLLVCGQCHSPKQCRVCLMGDEKTVMCLCRCGGAARDQREHEERVRQLEEAYFDEKRKGEPPSSLLKWFDSHNWRISPRLEKERIELLRYMCFGDGIMRHWRFEADDGTNPAITEVMKCYVTNFSQIASSDGLRGLCFLGPCGTGKSFMAACVANQLIDQGVPVVFTNFSTIRNRLQASFAGRQEYIDELANCPLLVIDDLGSEANTDFMREIIYTVINARYLTGRPFIVTTNITNEELKNTKDEGMRRILSRIYEMCYPIGFSGKDKRRALLSSNAPKFKAKVGMV